MEEMIPATDQFYITTMSSMMNDRTHVLKQGDTFTVVDRYGDVQAIGAGKQGLYHGGTRFLSRWALRLGKDRPLLLSSTVKQDNILFSADLSNPDTVKENQNLVPRGTIHIFRAKFLWKGVCYERLRLSNFGLVPADVDLSYAFDADFADIFEVRGSTRSRRGRMLDPELSGSGVTLAYEGLDNVVRRTRIDCSPKPGAIDQRAIHFAERLEPNTEKIFLTTVACEMPDAVPHPLSFENALAEAEHALSRSVARESDPVASNDQFDGWLRRSVADLHMMVNDLPTGPYPYAGVPWFSTVFGRDGIITALQSLWLNPALARGVLSYLASTQATDVVPEEDAEPGKILHEMRTGEMAALKEIPFGRYYGSVDATPLFVLLAGAYYQRTADKAFIESLWPAVESALQWIDRYGDADDDGFVEYARRSSHGLIQQGWKDSQDSIFHADGALAEGPIALCEVQGYVYAAKKTASELAWALHRPERAARLAGEAKTLREKFEQAFWCDELNTFAIALDGQKKQCRVRTSNAGHALFTGAASEARARKLAETLFEDTSFSGWGIRTVDSREKRYNPMSYHNGSVWPHDNALISLGLSRYGFKEEALKILDAVFEFTKFVEVQRLPELFCGFRRRPGEGPTQYPVACSPQAWASASAFMMLQACLGIEVLGTESKVTFSKPALPEFVDELCVKDLRVGDGSVDICVQGRGSDVDVNVLRREGSVEVAVYK